MKIDLNNYQEIERDNSFDYGPHRKYRKHKKWRKLIISLTIAFFVVVIISYLIIRFFVGPIVKTVDGLPGGFPTELSIYQVDKAQINLQNQESRFLCLLRKFIKLF